MASVILDNLAAGITREEIIDSYPPVTESDIRAVIAYVAELAREQVIHLPTEKLKMPDYTLEFAGRQQMHFQGIDALEAWLRQSPKRSGLTLFHGDAGLGPGKELTGGNIQEILDRVADAREKNRWLIIDGESNPTEFRV